jgi:hypothetical protein
MSPSVSLHNKLQQYQHHRAVGTLQPLGHWQFWTGVGREAVPPSTPINLLSNIGIYLNEAAPSPPDCCVTQQRRGWKTRTSRNRPVAKWVAKTCLALSPTTSLWVTSLRDWARNFPLFWSSTIIVNWVRSHHWSSPWVRWCTSQSETLFLF